MTPFSSYLRPIELHAHTFANEFSDVSGVSRSPVFTNYNLLFICQIRIARKVYFFFSKPQLPKQQDGVTVLLDTRRDDTVTDLQFLRK